MKLFLPAIRKRLFQRNAVVLARRLQLSTSPVASASNKTEARVTKLANGLCVVSQNNGLPTCTVGFWINSGSRLETSANNGSAHFLERLAFKGTENRKQLDLEQEIENMGAQLNSTISRDRTAYYGTCLKKDMPKMLEILTDVTYNSALYEENIEQQRGVILREMEEIEKHNHEAVVLDYLHATAYQGTPLGLTVQGTSENILEFSQADLTEYRKLYYTPSRTVLAGAGDIDHDKLVDTAKQLFGTKDTEKDTFNRVLPQPCRYTGSEIRHRNDDMPFVHVALAIEGVGWDHPDHLIMMVANQIIGGWDRTAVNGTNFPNPLVRRMADEGLCVKYQAFNHMYADTGLWGLYFVSDNDNVFDCSVRMQDEWMRLCTNLTDFEVTRAKNTLMTNLALNVDSSAFLCQLLGRQMLFRGRLFSWEDTAKRIMDIQARDVRRAVNTYVWDTCPAVASLGPTEAVPHYANVRAKMYKVFY